MRITDYPIGTKFITRKGTIVTFTGTDFLSPNYPIQVTLENDTSINLTLKGFYWADEHINDMDIFKPVQKPLKQSQPQSELELAIISIIL